MKLRAVVALVLLCAVAVRAEEPPEWAMYRQGLSSLTAGSSSTTTLASLLDWQYSLPLQYVRRGQAFVGPNQRLRRVMADMLAGKQVQITVLGGSISTGAVASRKQDPVNPNDAWSLVRLYAQDKISKDITFKNNARSATKSYINSMCLSKFLPSTSELVFVEFIANDGSDMDTSLNSTTMSQSYERLLRKILALPTAPAVVLVQMMPNQMAYPDGGQDGKVKINYAATPEDSYRNLAQYYDIPALSFRDTVYQLGNNGKLGYSWEKFMGPDRLHPNDLGHKVMADMVVYLLQQTALSTVLQPVGTPEAAALPVPMYPGNKVSTGTSMCGMGPDLAKYVVEDKSWQVVKSQYTYPTTGYESSTPDAPLTVAVDTSGAGASTASVTFVYTKAQKGYGGMFVSCVRGCTCEKKYVDGSLTYDQVVVFIDTIKPTAAPDCYVSFEIASNSTGKMRVSGIAVNGDSGTLAGRIGEEKYMAWLTGTNWEA